MNKSMIETLIAQHRRVHNGLQVERFIIGGSGITRYGMYRQALREVPCSRLEA